MHKREERKCEECGKVFKAYRDWQRFCGTSCRNTNWQKNNPRVKLVREEPGTITNSDNLEKLIKLRDKH